MRNHELRPPSGRPLILDALRRLRFFPLLAVASSSAIGLTSCAHRGGHGPDALTADLLGVTHIQLPDPGTALPAVSLPPDTCVLPAKVSLQCDWSRAVTHTTDRPVQFRTVGARASWGPTNKEQHLILESGEHVRILPGAKFPRTYQLLDEPFYFLSIRAFSDRDRLFATFFEPLTNTATRDAAAIRSTLAAAVKPHMEYPYSLAILPPGSRTTDHTVVVPHGIGSSCLLRVFAFDTPPGADYTHRGSEQGTVGHASWRPASLLQSATDEALAAYREALNAPSATSLLTAHVDLVTCKITVVDRHKH